MQWCNNNMRYKILFFFARLSNANGVGFENDKTTTTTTTIQHDPIYHEYPDWIINSDPNCYLGIFFRIRNTWPKCIVIRLKIGCRYRGTARYGRDHYCCNHAKSGMVGNIVEFDEHIVGATINHFDRKTIPLSDSYRSKRVSTNPNWKSFKFVTEK